MPQIEGYSSNKLEQLFEKIYKSQENQFEIMKKIRAKEEIGDMPIQLYDELLEECIFEKHLRIILDKVIIPNKKSLLKTTDQDSLVN